MQLHELELADLDSLAFRYSVMEFATAIKPTCFKHLLVGLGYDAAIYLDPDIRLFAPLHSVDEAFHEGASMVLTPHLLAPLEDEARPTDLDILASGTFNLGFAAARNCGEMREFLNWWEIRLKQQGYNDIGRGMFVDQKFIDFAPSFLPRLHIIRDPGYNVAYWNLAHRPITRAGSDWRAGEAPLTFFHFSGVVPGDPGIFSKHQTRYSIADIGPAADLISDYLQHLQNNGHATWSVVPYAFGHFEDGMRIPDVVRRAPPHGKPPQDWWRCLDMSYWNTPSDRVDQDSGSRITRLMHAIYETRPDIQAAFPLSHKQGRRSFHAWFLTHGADEHRLDEALHAAAYESSAGKFPYLVRALARLRLRFGAKPAK